MYNTIEADWVFTSIISHAATSKTVISKISSSRNTFEPLEVSLIARSVGAVGSNKQVERQDMAHAYTQLN